MYYPTTTRADSIHKDGTLIDRYGRHITYLRMSVTDRCDLRCRYCMPIKMTFSPKKDLLSLDELVVLAQVFASLGVYKIRLTGGEPLVRKNILWLCEKIANIDGITELAMTSNGTQLQKFAKPLAAAGVHRINISLDTLDADKFRQLTHNGRLSDVLAGIKAAGQAGFPKRSKINTVMMKGFNDDEIIGLIEFARTRALDISFIEEMPLGDIGYERQASYFSADDAIRLIRRHFSITESNHQSGGPARYWQLAGAATRIGFITPHSHNFCLNCNRVRTTATGLLYPCLGHDDAIDIREVMRQSDNPFQAIKDKIMQLMAIKPKGHEFNLQKENISVVRFMSATGG